MHVRILLFAGLRERFQKGELLLDLPRGTRAGDILKILCGDGGEAEKWARSVLLAVNQEYAAAGTEMREGDELALIPPMAGG